MAKRARNPDVPEISEATRLAFKSELAEKLQSKAESKAKRLGWGARLEAAAQAGAGVELENIAASQQKAPKEKKSKHKKKHKSHRKKRRRTSSESDDSREIGKRPKEKKHKSRSRKSKHHDSTSCESDTEDGQHNSSHRSRLEDPVIISSHQISSRGQ
ncbi:hypothetical protein ABBQ32_009178 [Trebouxia sp. C0010 RCD-2024]